MRAEEWFDPPLSEFIRFDPRSIDFDFACLVPALPA
jgi:hypothetical protein